MNYSNCVSFDSRAEYLLDAIDRALICESEIIFSDITKGELRSFITEAKQVYDAWVWNEV